MMPQIMVMIRRLTYHMAVFSATLPSGDHFGDCGPVITLDVPSDGL